MTKKSGIFSLMELYNKFIRDSRSGRRLQPNGKRVTAGTIESYQYTQKLIGEFCAKTNTDLRIRSVRKLPGRELLNEKKYWKRFYQSFTSYLYDDCGYYDNYAGVTIKNIRTFFNYLNKELSLNIGEFHKTFYVRKEEVAIFPLLPEELNYLINDISFTEHLSPRMREVKDFFVFGCTVALRFSDLLGLKKANLRIVNGQSYLAVKSMKTGSDTLVRLPEYAIHIIQRYARRGSRLLPKFNIVNLNKFIKRLLEQAGFTHAVQVSRSRRGIAVELHTRQHTSVRFCDVATTHTMRRTAITSMLSLGMPEQVVRKISGHSPSSKEFYRYVAWAQQYQDQETTLMFEKLATKSLTRV
jgi:integrase